MKNQELIIYGLLAAIVVYTVSKITGLTDAAGDKIDEIITGQSGPLPLKLSDLGADSTDLSITPEVADHIAGQVHDAMSMIGTDEDAIIDLVNPLNPTDWALVYIRFGIRRYVEPTVWNALGIPYPAVNHDYDLKQWLQAELSDSWLEEINELVGGYINL